MISIARKYLFAGAFFAVLVTAPTFANDICLETGKTVAHDIDFPLLENPTAAGAWWGDVNGDGLMDLIRGFNDSRKPDITTYLVTLADVSNTSTKFRKTIEHESKYRAAKGRPFGSQDSFVMNLAWVIDINGDGRVDIIYSRENNLKEYRVMLGQADGTFSSDKPAGTLYEHNDVGWDHRGQWWAQVDSDPYMDLVYNRNNHREFWVKFGQADGTLGKDVKGGSALNGFFADGQAAWMTDVNNDQRADFVWDSGDYFHVLESSGSKTQPFNKQKDMGKRRYGVELSTFKFPLVNDAPAEWWADVNGDGRSDLVYINKPGKDTNGKSVVSQFQVQLTSSAGKLSAETAWLNSPADVGSIANYVRLADMNLDGKAELIFPIEAKEWFHFQSLDYVVLKYPASPPVVSTVMSDWPFSPGLGDINGDQLLDMVAPENFLSTLTGNLSCGRSYETALTYDETDEGYTMKLGIGVDALDFLIDTGSSNLIVTASNCRQCPECPESQKPCKHPSSCPTAPPCAAMSYKPSDRTLALPLSGTCKPEHDDTVFQEFFADDTGVRSETSYDLVYLSGNGGSTQSSRKFTAPFGVFDITYGDVPNIFGLGYANDATKGTVSSLPCMFEALNAENHVFEICLRGQTGTLRLGGLTLKSSSYTFAPVLRDGDGKYTDYAIGTSMLITADRGINNPVGHFGDKDHFGEAIVDSGTADISLPTKLYDDVLDYLTTVAHDKQIKVIKQDPFTVNTTEISEFPTIRLVLEGGDTIDLCSDTCWKRLGKSDFYELNMSGYSGPTLLGVPFMANYRTAFDLETNRIGFAPRSSTSQCDI